ncbi:hypothetical protein FQN57_002689 [Myotisia sp. PD_48]|nr:hypothetical protein FQN57_002689 [Myotisia sp. PD_48]
MHDSINGGAGPRGATRVLSVPRLSQSQDIFKQWSVERDQNTSEAKALLEAAELLRTTDIPVAFPTETVYGLGADATRSAAVQGIYKAKQRPSDNPLIVHVHSRQQLENLLQPPQTPEKDSQVDCGQPPISRIPKIYEPIIEKFWPGPLTIILPNPPHSPLAPEVTAHLSTFGVRMPSSPLARLLIQLTDRPLAAPSANASTRPSPTTAQHVYTDLNGRIDLILDGGPSGVGVESTVVDGLSDPPAVLRPGGIGIEELRSCPGWENVQRGYKDGALQGKATPRAPGMKYKHYSPKARVVLFEAGQDQKSASKCIVSDWMKQHSSNDDKNNVGSIGVIRTMTWNKGVGLATVAPSSFDRSLSLNNTPSKIQILLANDPSTPINMYDIDLGKDTPSIARGLFSALRCLDEQNVSVIYVEGVSDAEGDLAAAIMNRLRKAAEIVKTEK